MERKYASWDIETHKITELAEGENIMDYRPLGITCISLLATGNTDPAVYYSGHRTGTPLARKMNIDELLDFVEELWAGFISGYVPLAWNGNFDFQILIEEIGSEHNETIKMIKKMARNSVDPMFHLFCKKGYPLALATAAKGMGVEGKTEGMTGALAPEMWQESEEARWKVIEYVKQDAVIPMNLVNAIESAHRLSWISKSGRAQYVYMNPILTVKDALKIPEPDTSWMKSPIQRSQFYGWAFEDEPTSFAHIISDHTGLDVGIVQRVLDAQDKLS